MKAITSLYSLLALALVLNVSVVSHVYAGNKWLEKGKEVAKTDAKPLYEKCLKKYKKTLSNKDAKKACENKLKSSYDNFKK